MKEKLSPEPAEKWDLLRKPPEFSLVLGGPLFQLLRRAHLADDALMMVRQRIMVITLLAWLPLALLAALEGELWGGSAAVPFLKDVEVHIRFLVTLPLLILAELVVHQRMRPLVKQFVERNLIPDNAMMRFSAAIDSAFRLRNSVLAEVLLIAVVYGVGIGVVWRHYLALDAVTWYATPSLAGPSLTWAGLWYLGVSLPQYKAEIAVVVVFMLCIVLGTLLVFTPQLSQVKRTGLRAYGTLAERYVREFDTKWLRGGAPANEPLVGSADIQSLADLGNSFGVVQDMRIVPVTRDALLRLVGATLAPIVPLALTMMSLEELLKRRMGVLF